MKTICKMLKRDSRGFTLVELMVVLLIIGILVAIAVPLFSNARKDAANKAHTANIRTLEGAGQTAVANDGIPGANVIWDSINDKGTNPPDKHAAKDYLKEWPNIPNGQTTDSGATGYKVTIDTTGSVTVDVLTGS